MAGIPFILALHRLQRLARTGVGVIEYGRRQFLLAIVNRQHISAVARQAIAVRTCHRLFVRIVTLGERSIEKTRHRDIEPVKPDHRLLAFIAVIVPGPGRGNDKIAIVHDRAFAVNRGVGAAAIEHETQRRLAVPVCRGDLAG